MSRARAWLVGILVGWCWAALASAGMLTTGSWVYDNSSYGQVRDFETTFALTINDADQALGLWCYPDDDRCLWVVLLPTGCQEDDRIPSLWNTQRKAVTLDLVCASPREISGKTYYRYVIADFKAVNEMLMAANGASVGVAFPLEGDKFRVARFSLNGVGKATEAALNPVNLKKAPPKKARPSSSEVM